MQRKRKKIFASKSEKYDTIVKKLGILTAKNIKTPNCHKNVSYTEFMYYYVGCD